MEIFKRKKYIYTEYEDEHIVNLEKANVPYQIREEIAFLEMLKKGYLSISVIGELLVVFGLIWVFFIN
jgi:ribosomal protein S2|tara:strand:- start:634 stop:837 length:204 start_codon:yes stop_codon:yes gene_type:complete